jgi:hypothetical protein
MGYRSRNTNVGLPAGEGRPNRHRTARARSTLIVTSRHRAYISHPADISIRRTRISLAAAPTRRGAMPFVVSDRRIRVSFRSSAQPD